MPERVLTVGRALPVDEVLARLAETPDRLAAVTAGVGADRLQPSPTADEWSATDVLAHLRACADVWGGCIERLLAEDRPTIRAVNPRQWIKSTDYRELGFHASLAAFAAQRAALLALLAGLPPEGWSRSATVTGAGKPLERTVMGFAVRLARHERPHVEQIDRAVKRSAG